MLPLGIQTSGFPAVRETCRQISIEFDNWQQDMNKCLLAKDAHGLYAADTAVMSIPRQVGKTYDVGAVAFALCIANPGLTVVWTAHRFKVARESFNEMKAWAKRKELAPHIDYDTITTAAGNECIPFRSGSRIVFAARERGAIRGFTKVGMLVLDEAQILSEAAMSDLVPTTNQSPNPLIILMGTPPKPTDPSEVFTRLRKDALDGESGDVLYVEFSADANANPDDRKQWGIANPSFPKRTPARAIQRLRKLLSPEDFLREAMGIWGENISGLPLDSWRDSLNQSSTIDSRMAFAVDVTPDRSRTSIVVAGSCTGDRVHVELVERGSGLKWAPKRMKELLDKWGANLVLDPSSPAGSLIPDLSELGIEPYLVSARDHAQACGLFVDLITEDRLRHIGQPELDDAIAGARRRDIGDGAWKWSRKDSLVDISPLVGATLAAWMVASTEGPSVYETRGLVTV